jgi:very-short-patch-repair endonuclease
MNRFRNLVTVFAFSLLILGLPAIASAQWRNDDDNYGNGRNRNNRNLEATIKNLKNRSQQFERALNRELDRDRYNRNNRGDRIEDLAEDFKDAAKRLDNEYDGRNNYDDSSDEANRVLQLGSQLDRALSRARLSNGLQNQWNQIQYDLRTLSNAYNGNYNNGNNRNNRNNRTNRNDDWRRNIPWPF